MPSISLPAAVIGAGVISAGAGLYGASQQAGAASDANALQGQIYQQNRADQTPWRAAGQNALAQLQYSLGIGPAPGAPLGPNGQSSNPDEPGTLAKIKQGLQAWNQNNPGSDNGIIAMIDKGAPLSQVTSALQSLRSSTTNGRNTAFLDPLIQQAQNPLSLTSNVVQSPVAGNINQPNVAAGGGTPQAGPYGAFQASPGYQFAFDQGRQAVDQSQAAKGMGKSGATLKALTRYGQGTANQEFGNWLNRLASVAGLGQTATAQTGTLGANYATAAGQNMQDAAAARASGYVGAGNAISGTVNNLASLGWFGNGGGSATYAGGVWTPGPQGFPG